MQAPEHSVDLSIDHILANPALRHRLFPVTRERIFLAHAGVAPLPTPTVEALKQEAERASFTQESVDYLAQIESIRRVGARLINATSEEVALLGPTSLGLNLVANGLEWREGEEVIYYPDDYPANVYAWQALAARGVRTVPLEPERMGEITPDLVLKAVTPRTKLVCLASCHFLSGFRLDYETIGEELSRRGVLFCLDAIQSLGATTIDVRHIDFLAADSHKWMLGPLGAGIFYVKRKHFDTLRPSAWWARGMCAFAWLRRAAGDRLRGHGAPLRTGRAEHARVAWHEGQFGADPWAGRETDRGAAARPALLSKKNQAAQRGIPSLGPRQTGARRNRASSPSASRIARRGGVGA